MATAVIAVLLALPASAQCCDDSDPEPMLPGHVYLPLVASPARQWFGQAELEAAQRSAGYDVAVVAEHTVCTLAASAQPPVIVRYSHCLQNWHDGQPTDGRLAVYYWFDGATVRSLLISSERGD